MSGLIPIFFSQSFTLYYWLFVTEREWMQKFEQFSFYNISVIRIEFTVDVIKPGIKHDIYYCMVLSFL